jgi:hypothetical protein
LLLDEIAREGARRMLIEALEAEVDDYVERHRRERNEQGTPWWCATAALKRAS